ncbi:MAG TPA: hypothetical protein VL402_09520 [Xanthobacteraceae bacterium]|jgi:hypothetical protein|nr:hypothetical protein [Xanthobacteraceae bacterium]
MFKRYGALVGGSFFGLALEGSSLDGEPRAAQSIGGDPMKGHRDEDFHQQFAAAKASIAD